MDTPSPLALRSTPLPEGSLRNAEAILLLLSFKLFNAFPGALRIMVCKAPCALPAATALASHRDLPSTTPSALIPAVHELPLSSENRPRHKISSA